MKELLVSILLAIVSICAMAEDYTRDGHPCLSGVCIGDEISTLQGIKWLPATQFGRPISFKVNDAQIKKLLERYVPNSATAVRASAPYLVAGSFDGKAIPKLAKLNGACNGVQLEGHFLSDSGLDTRVFVSFVPGADLSSQSMQVSMIMRKFTGRHTDEQEDALFTQLKERYQGTTGNEWKLAPDFLSDKPGLLLTLISSADLDLLDKLKSYPGCTKSLSID